MRKVPQLAIMLFAVAALILIHQYVTWGKWWEWQDFLHHEVFAGMLIFGALVLIYYVHKRRG